jgi:hypothetical protein
VNDVSAKQRFIAGLSAIRESIGTLDPSLNVNRVTRYEISQATKALYVFVAGSGKEFLRSGDGRLRRVLAMVPLKMRRELAPIAEEALEALASLTAEERLELAGEWATIFGTNAIPVGLRGQALPEGGPETFRDEIDLARDILRRLPVGLERWVWSAPDKTRGAGRWHIDDEFHFQSLLWLALAPALRGLRYEEYLPSVGRRRPRVDLALPKSQLAIEAKFMRGPADFSRVEDQIATDSAMYVSASPARYSRLIAVVWDETRCTERHQGFIEGLKAFRGVLDAFVISRPGRMEGSGASEVS